MSSNSSVHKSANAFSLLVAGAVASLLTAPFLSSTAPLIKSQMAQLAPSNSTTPEVAKLVDPAKIIFGLAIIGGGAGAIFVSTKKASHHSVSSARSQENTIRLDQASPKLQKKLLILLHNDLPTANRLVAQAKRKDPTRSINWYVEKAIYDLERDRSR
ncbi:MAG: hypothetical protein F6K28_20980 [Microcoleus sp. SIO2G3]|nr:hypothetical protein [Microcoleus sp. SIO2G3]